MAPNLRTTMPPLSRESIVATSMDLLRDSGLEGVTMRSVAAELGVTPMALYSHIDSKEELVSLVAAEALANLPAVTLHDGDWQESLRQYLISVWEAVAPHPGLAAYIISLPTMGSRRVAYASGTRLLEDAGFSPRQAQLGWLFATTFIHGRLSIDARFDRRAAHEVGLADFGAREHALFGIEAVIHGLEAILGSPNEPVDVAPTDPPGDS